MKMKGLRWWIIGLIFLATVINYIDRTAISVMWPGISEELGFTKYHYAIMLNVFMVAYALGQSLSGRMFDKIGTRMGYVVSIMVWGASTALHSVARGLISFSIFRAMLGLSEAGNWPGAVKSNAEWFPIKERAIAQGIFNAGASMGSVIAPPLIAMLYVGYGWRVTFFIVGSLVLIWVIPWLIINKATPNKHPWLSDEERDHILEGRQERDIKEEGKVLSLSEILSHRESWAVLVSRFFLEPIWWLFVGWMPIYLADKYGFDVKEIGFFAWVPYVGAGLGSLAGGWFSGRLITKTGSVDKARKTTISIGAVLMFLGLVATILMANTPEKFVGIVALVLFGFQFSISNVQTLPSDLFSGKSVGTLAGFGGTVGVLSVILMNFLIPVITQESYTPAFVAIALFVPLGVIAIYVLCKKIEPIKIKNH
ncbi:MFS transporter [Echinicola strongylocentroti]|uniref:MFS transporter n=1 Tax=Echinicola strongylocentroti TaxID=1795355 RepID=A0A2Z4ID67_9BACT|nr:MFS transporter [Echinicola strongylocentroti]AWW28789.1 MFS transporter [Echinicola strongylocentroti]